MKEVLFKKEYSKYETVEHEPSSPFPYFRKKIKDEILGFDSEVGPVPTKNTHYLFIKKLTILKKSSLLDLLTKCILFIECIVPLS